MEQDSTYIFKATVVEDSTGVYYQIPKRDFKAVYEQAFGEMLTVDVARDHLVLFFTYVPLMLAVLIVITLVNRQWNIRYLKVKEAERLALERNELTEKAKENMRKLDNKQIKIPNRLFHFATVWAGAALLDIPLMLYAGVPIPVSAIFAIGYSVNRIFVRLAEISKLSGITDENLVEYFDKYSTGILLDPIRDLIRKLILKE